jgi:hypothetical protein
LAAIQKTTSQLRRGLPEKLRLASGGKCATNKLLLFEPTTKNKNYKKSEGTRRIR